MQHFVGPANRFVCHSWKSSFSGLIDGLIDSVHENEAILWIDVFSMQLHQLEASKKEETFYFDDVKFVMSRMKSFSLFLHPLLNPAIFESRWLVNHQHQAIFVHMHFAAHFLCRCLFETIIFLEAQPFNVVDVVLSPGEYLQLSNQLHIVSYATSVERTLAKVQLATSNCTHPLRISTTALVPPGSDSTYSRLNEKLFSAMRTWLIKTLMYHFDKSLRINDDFHINSLMLAVNRFFQESDDNFSPLPFLAKFSHYKRVRFGEYHVEALVSMYDYAKGMHRLQRYHEAAGLFHQCLRIKSFISGLEDTTVLSLKHDLAVVLLKFFSNDAAHALLEVCVVNRHLLLGDDHSDTLTSEFHFASVLGLANRFDAALSLIDSCLQKRIRLFGPDHATSLQALSCKAQLTFTHFSHSINQRTVSATQVGSTQIEIENLFKVCLAKQEIVLGKLHDDTVSTRNNLALVYSSFGDLRRARTLFSESLHAIQSSLGSNHPTSFGTMRCLGSVAMASGDTSTAERIYTECLTALRNVFGMQHPTTLMTIEDLGHVHVASGKFESALALFQECTDAWSSMGYFSRSFSIDLYRAATFRIQGNLSKAHSVAYGCLLESNRQLGPDHSATMGLEVELGDILFAAARWAEAKVLFKRVVEKKLAVDGPDNNSVILLMSKLANVYEKLKKYAKAQKLHIFVYNFYVKQLGDYHPDTIQIMSQLARCMFQCDDLDSCESLTMSCLERHRSMRLQLLEQQQQLRSLLDAVRRRRIQITTFDKESSDCDLLLAMNMSLSLQQKTQGQGQE